ITVIVREVPRYLAEGGHVIFEIGYNQADRVIEMTEGDDRFDSLVAIRDLNDIDRVIMLTCK
ncbi:MAG: peptide chain release factor N(5)-glutamine methyltransferase, partial [candidate division Zixibacteria bacterium]|nr:peptide chain release factor N(5)-glutamine methyltransferase [candidate division Zixibacteria bacterium]